MKKTNNLKTITYSAVSLESVIHLLDQTTAEFTVSAPAGDVKVTTPRAERIYRRSAAAPDNRLLAATAPDNRLLGTAAPDNRLLAAATPDPRLFAAASPDTSLGAFVVPAGLQVEATTPVNVGGFGAQLAPAATAVGHRTGERETVVQEFAQ